MKLLMDASTYVSRWKITDGSHVSLKHQVVAFGPTVRLAERHPLRVVPAGSHTAPGLRVAVRRLPVSFEECPDTFMRNVTHIVSK